MTDDVSDASNSDEDEDDDDDDASWLQSESESEAEAEAKSDLDATETATEDAAVGVPCKMVSEASESDARAGDTYPFAGRLLHNGRNHYSVLVSRADMVLVTEAFPHLARLFVPFERYIRCGMQ